MSLCDKGRLAAWFPHIVTFVSFHVLYGNPLHWGLLGVTKDLEGPLFRRCLQKDVVETPEFFISIWWTQEIFSGVFSCAFFHEINQIPHNWVPQIQKQFSFEVLVVKSLNYFVWYEWRREIAIWGTEIKGRNEFVQVSEVKGSPAVAKGFVDEKSGFEISQVCLYVINACQAPKTWMISLYNSIKCQWSCEGIPLFAYKTWGPCLQQEFFP